MQNNPSPMDSKQAWQRITRDFFAVCTLHEIISILLGTQTLSRALGNSVGLLLGLGVQAFLFKDRFFLDPEIAKLTKAAERSVMILGIHLKDEFRMSRLISRLGAHRFVWKLLLSVSLLSYGLYHLHDLFGLRTIALILLVMSCARPIWFFVPLWISSLGVIASVHESGSMATYGGLSALVTTLGADIYFICLVTMFDRLAHIITNLKGGLRHSAKPFHSILLFMSLSFALFYILPKKPLDMRSRSPKIAQKSTPSSKHSPVVTAVPPRPGATKNLDASALPSDIHTPEGGNAQVDLNEQLDGSLKHDGSLDSEEETHAQQNERDVSPSSSPIKDIDGEHLKNLAANLREQEASLKQAEDERGRNQMGADTPAAELPGNKHQTKSKNSPQKNFLQSLNTHMKTVFNNPHIKKKLIVKYKWLLMIGSVLLACCGIYYFFLRRNPQKQKRLSKEEKIRRKILINQFHDELEQLCIESITHGESSRLFVVKVYQLLLLHLERSGFAKAEGETPDEYCAKEIFGQKNMQQAFKSVTHNFCMAYYGLRIPEPHHIVQLISHAKSLGSHTLFI